jgi:hypothetical protein
MKVEKNRILLYSSLPTGTYHKDLSTWIFFFLNLENFGFFFFFFFFQSEKSFAFVEIIFFRSKFCKILPPKKTLVLASYLSF